MAPEQGASWAVSVARAGPGCQGTRPGPGEERPACAGQRVVPGGGMRAWGRGTTFYLLDHVCVQPVVRQGSRKLPTSPSRLELGTGLRRGSFPAWSRARGSGEVLPVRDGWDNAVRALSGWLRRFWPWGSPGALGLGCPPAPIRADLRFQDLPKSLDGQGVSLFCRLAWTARCPGWGRRTSSLPGLRVHRADAEWPAPGCSAPVFAEQLAWGSLNRLRRQLGAGPGCWV